MTIQTSTTTDPLRQRAFTLTELMLVIIVLVMVAGISGTYYMETYKKSSLRAAARNLMLMGKYARLYAVENGQTCQIYLSRARNQFFLRGSRYDEAQGSNYMTTISNPYCRKVMLKSGIEFEVFRSQPVRSTKDASSDKNDCIHFYPDGSCDAAVIQVGNGRHSMTAIFSAAYAKIKIYEGPADTVENRLQAIDLDAVD